ncbi:MULTISPECIES: hypothetical protein [Pseudomonas]|uniref:Uncharacterized protein n=1 Tax=Pseudomonas wuhanensis TaxID=2954098 RepID=A0ABY9GVK9_9PSED|nr:MULTISPECIES: hypothetical protein [unclassified Pseudomonas]WLI13889.1 hypothetical protein PSH65_07045 [Pseudomonas sp. FP603]WLI19787.1 hypothetical protein PSH88_07050 [Pseudomonas sp. FP607]
MFITNRQAEVKGSQALLEPGHQGWHFVQQHLMSPWFHTTIVRCEDGLEIHDVVFVDSLQALTSILELTEAGVQVRSVQLVSPGWLNGTGDWRMDTLLEVAQSQDGTSLRYTLHDGRHFYFPEAQPDASEKYSVLVFPTRENDGP